jgi:hypothetical protein
VTGNPQGYPLKWLLFVALTSFPVVQNHDQEQTQLLIVRGWENGVGATTDSLRIGASLTNSKAA